MQNKLVHKLVEECSENIDGNEMICNGNLNDHKKVCNSRTIYTVLFVIAFLITISISSAFIYFHWYLKSDASITNLNAGNETVKY